MQPNKQISWQLLVIFLLFLSSCQPWSREYRDFYSYAKKSYDSSPIPMQESDFFLVILVNARHLDYTDTRSFFKTVAKHPTDGSKSGDVGHAWIYLQGKVNGKVWVLEGGHSGERGRLQARYFDGIMNYNDWGYANPSDEQKQYPRYEPNPVKYLWATLEDGYFEKGAGGHRPTYAAKVDLTEQQFYRILQFIHPRYYPYRQYALTNLQCSSYAAQVAVLADLYVESEVSMAVQPRIWFGRRWVRFWTDPCYSVITFSSPDVLEKSLMEAVQEGRAEYALDWYLKKRL
ncbi:hypothetical protein [Candidatus Protochlamydia phocaeensis]|uniref:hypothetical protein n=1 Tax=Candidatus Protochlamydia phocaeensis TaxID=1414722 RepID=UPI000838FFE4|nr:hypothetical protein [Candidatus Protochlamydia phocaeensis]